MPSPEESAKTRDLPEREDSSFHFDRLIVHRAGFEELPLDARVDGEVQPQKTGIVIGIAASIQMNPENRHAVVTMEFDIKPDPKWQAYRIGIKLSGVFAGRNVSVEKFDHFCRGAAAAILFPYVREITHSLTRDALYGSVRIDPMPIGELSERADWGEPRKVPTPPALDQP